MKERYIVGPSKALREAGITFKEASLDATDWYDAVQQQSEELGWNTRFTMRSILKGLSARKAYPKKRGRKKKEDIFSSEYTGPVRE